MNEHTNKQFHSDLEATRSLFLQMGGIVESMVRSATEALQSGDMSLVDQVREREKEINRLEVEIDERITNLIARNQPTAIDLRMLLSISKMLTDMERCGDEAERIAKMARRLHEGTAGYEPVVELRHMSSSVAGMINDVLDAFARQDAVHAAQIVRSDKEVDREWKGSLRHIITYMIEDPRTISHSIDLIFIARALERIGDHAKNMAERVIYMVRGDDVRHTGVKNTERTARGEPLPEPESEDKA
ncbi:phosphate signaling complex protein PhoU [Alcaligenes faecalis]|jgi:phosphate transport system protein|uniref:Phosphate-specific transport system accessory protein PhoU n=1 Tax=Alcaligenes faecalis TaxID=511 RepID=A0A2U2BJT3_ALCFA|nr:phosphate signaling complex protein PhoU [Alcaligenes faecalis]ALO37671.1 transcriptional regulator PhoU [Alcaligenes faecalis]MBW4790281.1 phosphate signaling complex protein PhoU [Alcaligenes faecalis subsp. faecalis]MBY6311602.1 phosphate signaling complex protein PhoU [Alcaligenes faecalis]MBY6317123.1 phosphate signaling complex protein PhoU [Alcaligenes faecalis]MBY6391205.1 phosphate signaling complex protein PhoU [Alcaligenes faecalis]